MLSIAMFCTFALVFTMGILLLGGESMVVQVTATNGDNGFSYIDAGGLMEEYIDKSWSFESNFSSNRRVVSTICVNSDFADDRVLVVLNQQKTTRILEAMESRECNNAINFSGLGIVEVEDLTRDSAEVLVEQKRKREIISTDGMNGMSDYSSVREWQRDSSIDIDACEFRIILSLTLERPGKENVLRTIRQLEQREYVLSAGVDFVMHNDSIAPNDPMFNQQWGLHGTHGINAPAAWGITTGLGRPAVRVGIIDTGVQANHPDLNVNTTLSRDFSLPYPHIPANVVDNNGHGTHVAGIVGARGNNNVGVAGVNWNVELVSLRISPTNLGNSFASHLIRAVNFAGANGIPIVNNSNGTDAFTGTVNDVNALAAAINQFPGLFVTSAGNGSRNNDTNNNRFPSNIRLPNIITVGASDNQGRRSSFSNWGLRNVCIFAPGGSDPRANTANGILSTRPTHLTSNIGAIGYYSTIGDNFMRTAGLRGNVLFTDINYVSVAPVRQVTMFLLRGFHSESMSGVQRVPRYPAIRNYAIAAVELPAGNVSVNTRIIWTLHTTTIVDNYYTVVFAFTKTVLGTAQVYTSGNFWE